MFLLRSLASQPSAGHSTQPLLRLAGCAGLNQDLFTPCTSSSATETRSTPEAPSTQVNVVTHSNSGPTTGLLQGAASLQSAHTNLQQFRCAHTSSQSPTPSQTSQPAASAQGNDLPLSLPNPPTGYGAYKVEVLLRAFEKRYLDHAATAVQDLMLVSCFPKSRGVFPHPPSADLKRTPANIFFGVEKKEIPVDWKRSRFGVIRGVFKHKQGGEHFEMREYAAKVTASTNSAAEVHWLLDYLKMYEFTGVQLEISVTSATYLTPSPLPTSLTSPSPPLNPSTSVPASSTPSILHQHKQAISPYLTPLSKPADDSVEDSFRQSLQVLRDALFSGLSDTRVQLGRSSQGYSMWHQKHKGSAPAEAGQFLDASGQHLAPSPLLNRHVPGWQILRAAVASSSSGQLPTASKSGSPVAESATQVSRSGNRGGSKDVDADSTSIADESQKARALLAALDAVFLDLSLTALERHKRFKYHICTFVPGSGIIPAAVWLQCLLKYAQYTEKLHGMTQEAEVMKAYTQYNLFTHVLLYQLLKMWVQRNASLGKAALALPSEDELRAFMKELASDRKAQATA